jgi:DNA-binding transcriptional regulator YhcF (GntR family)
MRNLYEKIQELQAIPSYSKHEQLVHGIINAIDEKLFTPGDMLPSVNALIKETGFARETIVKAYSELKNRGIIASRNRLGFYVTNKDTEQTLKVALLMFGYDTFQEIFYNNFREGIGDKIHVDVFFHHNNIDVFETILEHIRGQYGMYVVSPIPHPKTANLLKSIPLNKFLMFDRYEPIEGDFSYISQEFEQSSFEAFSEIASDIKKYDKMVFYYKLSSDIPIEILRAYQKFLKEYKINGETRSGYKMGAIEKGCMYFTIDNSVLYDIIKDCKLSGLSIGTDVGILSHNDEPVKEIIVNGITTYSTDFAMMGKKAANFVLTREKIQEILPTVLIRRNSI